MPGPITIDAVIHQLPIFMKQTEENSAAIQEILLELRTLSITMQSMQKGSVSQEDKLDDYFKIQAKLLERLSTRVSKLEQLKYYMLGLAAAAVLAFEIAKFIFKD